MSDLIDFIDTHFHAKQMSEKGLDPAECLDAAEAEGMRFAVEIGTHPAELPDRLRLLPPRPGILRSSGIGPSAAGEAWEDALPMLEGQLSSGGIKAIGEIGLDWHWNYGTQERQIELCRSQIDLANRYGVPIIVHNRDADTDIVDLLRIIPPERGGIMHCFSADWPTARRCIDAGLYISFAGNITYRSSESLREVLKKVPKERLLLETDSPYLSPQIVRGKPNQPLNVKYVYECAAELTDLPLQDLAATIVENVVGCFDINDRE